MAKSSRQRGRQERDGSSIPLRVGRDEMNLAEFPFALLADRHPDGVDTIVFTDTVQGEDGPVERVWTVTGSEEFGLPLASDELVYIALMEVTKEQGFDSRTIYITRYDLIKRLGWPDKGGSYARLEACLDRLLGVTIKAERAFWDNRKRRYVDVGFHVIDDYAIYDEQPGRKSAAGPSRLPFSYVAWNQVVFASFKAGYIKHLDTAFFFGLRSALSRRLYRYLDKKRYDGKPVFRIGLRKLAFEKLGMSRNYYPSHIKQELARAHEELTEAGFLRGVEYQQRPGRQDDLVAYRFTPRRYLVEDESAVSTVPGLPAPTDRHPTSGQNRAASTEDLAPAPRAPAQPPGGAGFQPADAVASEAGPRLGRDADAQAADRPLADQLVAVGVTRAVARSLVAEFGAEVQAQLEYLPFRAPRDPAALLVEAIRGCWEPPASYLRECKERSERRAEADAHRRRLDRARREQLIETIERRAAEAVLADLPSAVRRRLEEEANRQVADSSPVLAGRPGSAAYQALLHDKLRRAVMSEYPADFNARRESLWADAAPRHDD